MAAGLDTLLPTLSRAAGLPLDGYRREHVGERIRRAVEREGLASAERLAALLQQSPDARTRFRRSVAVSVSGLFRDPAQFELLERVLLPELLANGKRVTVWSAGCADGSELQSVALLLDRLDVLDRALLLGSDVLEENLAVARRGIHVSDSVRSRLRWEQRDLLTAGPPSGSWRLVLCRNVAIYLTRAAHRALYATLASALAAGGILLLGRAERIAEPSALGLERVAEHAYRKVVSCAA